MRQWLLRMPESVCDGNHTQVLKLQLETRVPIK
jgi:hypothetical protein